MHKHTTIIHRRDTFLSAERLFQNVFLLPSPFLTTAHGFCAAHKGQEGLMTFLTMFAIPFRWKGTDRSYGQIMAALR